MTGSRTNKSTSSAPTGISAYIEAMHYSSYSNLHYSGYDQSSVDYPVLNAAQKGLPANFYSTQYAASLRRPEITDDYRKTYFTPEYFMQHADQVSAPADRTILWSGGHIPNHPRHYGLGRVSVEATLVYLNQLIDTDDSFSTAAMTKGALPVLNPLWSDSNSSHQLKYELTTQYIERFVKNAIGSRLSLNVDDTGLNSYFRCIELPILMRLEHIKQIQVFRLEKATHLPTILTYDKEDWYQVQRNQWVQSIIIRTELALSEVEKLGEDAVDESLNTHKNRMIASLKTELLHAVRCFKQSDPYIKNSELTRLYEMKRIAQFGQYYYQRKDLFSGFDSGIIRLLKTARMRYCIMQIMSLLPRVAELGFHSGYWLELIDPMHRKKTIHEDALKKWEQSSTGLNYFDWLNVTYPESQYEQAIRYFKNSEMGQFALNIKEDGLLYDSTGTLFDTQKLNGKLPQFSLFVLRPSPDKEASGQAMLYAYEYVNGHLHHSSFTRQERALSAGMLRVVNGKITHISFMSGHVRPSYQSIDSLLSFLPDAALRRVTVLLSFCDGLVTTGSYPEYKYDQYRVGALIQGRNRQAEFPLFISMADYYDGERHYELVPPINALSVYNIPNIDPQKSIRRLYSTEKGRINLFISLFHPKNNRYSIDHLLYLSERSGVDLIEIAANSLKWERIVKHIVIAAVMARVKCSAISGELVNAAYQMAMNRIERPEISNLYLKIHADIERFVFIFTQLGADASKGFKYHDEFGQLMAKIDDNTSEKTVIAKQILFDRHYTKSVTEYLSECITLLMNTYLTKKSDFLLTNYPLSQRASYEIQGGIATGKSTFSDKIQYATNDDYCFINHNFIARFLGRAISSPFDYLDHQLCCNEIDLVRLLLINQLQRIVQEQNALPNFIIEDVQASTPELRKLTLMGGGTLTLCLFSASEPLLSLGAAFWRANQNNRFMASQAVFFTHKKSSVQLAEIVIDSCRKPLDLLAHLNPQIKVDIYQDKKLIARTDAQTLKVLDFSRWRQLLSNIHINHNFDGRNGRLYPIDIEERVEQSAQQIQSLLAQNNMRLEIKEDLEERLKVSRYIK